MKVSKKTLDLFIAAVKSRANSNKIEQQLNSSGGGFFILDEMKMPLHTDAIPTFLAFCHEFNLTPTVKYSSIDERKHYGEAIVSFDGLTVSIFEACGVASKYKLKDITAENIKNIEIEIEIDADADAKEAKLKNLNSFIIKLMKGNVKNYGKHEIAR